MYENALSVYAFGLGYCERLSAELDDAALYQRATASLHAPAWILGHLSIATDWAGAHPGAGARMPGVVASGVQPGKNGGDADRGASDEAGVSGGAEPGA